MGLEPSLGPPIIGSGARFTGTQANFEQFAWVTASSYDWQLIPFFPEVFKPTQSWGVSRFAQSPIPMVPEDSIDGPHRRERHCQMSKSRWIEARGVSSDVSM
jgi:hypothetical protein